MTTVGSPAGGGSTGDRGPHDDIDVTYGRPGAWAAKHVLAVDGPVHETYLVGPRETDNSSRWRTKIGWPIFRLAQQ
ncbi:GyrI-like domain-containing protein [Catellatospora sp. NPDC049111]|uniref:GyrI-like domain-containing protein n=1 Tax=Catellatospora sp. NPDC049111 TaxID=3155271 RepID=UPI0033D1DB9B